MDLMEAIRQRHSVRAYKDEPLTAEVVAALRQKIAAINSESGLRMQLVTDEPRAFLGVLARYGRFRNVRNYVIVIGRKGDDLDECVGYYGEQLVLFAQTLGLNTCWVGLSYSKVPGTYQLEEGEKIACYISIGYGETQGSGHKIKRVEQVSRSKEDNTPQWFVKGVEAALLAPTAVNQQKFVFEYLGVVAGRPRVRAHRGMSLFGYTQMDLGIAKYHFEIGAGKENFEWA